MERALLRRLRPIAYSMLVLVLCMPPLAHRPTAVESWQPMQVALCTVTAVCVAIGMEFCMPQPALTPSRDC